MMVMLASTTPGQHSITQCRERSRRPLVTWHSARLRTVLLFRQIIRIIFPSAPFLEQKLNWNEFRLMSIRGITNPFALSRVPEKEFKFAFWLVCSANPRANTRAAGGFGDLKWHAGEKWTEWQDPPGGRQVTSVGQPAGSCSLIQTFFSPFVSMFHSLVNGRGKPSAVSKWKM